MTFLLGDVLDMPFAETFDIIWSRDALMHLPDKPRLFSRLHDLTGARRPTRDHRLRPGDLARARPSSGPTSSRRAITSTDPASYGKLLEGAGFVDVVVEDATGQFVDILERESERLVDPSRRLPRVVLGAGPELPARPLGDEGRASATPAT